MDADFPLPDYLATRLFFFFLLPRLHRPSRDNYVDHRLSVHRVPHIRTSYASTLFVRKPFPSLLLFPTYLSTHIHAYIRTYIPYHTTCTK